MFIISIDTTQCSQNNWKNRTIENFSCQYISLSWDLLNQTLLEKVEIPMEFRDRIYFVSTRDGIRDGKSN